MEEKRITIHRALTELKIIDSKILKAIESIEPSGVKQKSKLVNGIYDENAFIANAKSKYQSVNDLINRKMKIKSAIVQANGETEVEITGQKMTIADAINYKAIVDFKKQLIGSLKTKHSQVKARFVRDNEKVEEVALANAKIMLGKENDNVQPTDADVNAIMEPFIERNKLIMIDPLNMDELIEKLEEEITNFEGEVDSALSEINAITFIEV